MWTYLAPNQSCDDIWNGPNNFLMFKVVVAPALFSGVYPLGRVCLGVCKHCPRLLVSPNTWTLVCWKGLVSDCMQAACSLHASELKRDEPHLHQSLEVFNSSKFFLIIIKNIYTARQAVKTIKTSSSF